MRRLTIRGTALSLGLFFDVSFLLCVPLFNYFEGGRPTETMQPTVTREVLHHR